MFDNELKRDGYLIPISRDHGVLLVLAQRLRKAAEGTTEDRIRLAGEIRGKLAELVKEYLHDEANALAPVALNEFVRAEMVLEHDSIEDSLDSLSSLNTPSSLIFTALADQIEQHVRWDERLLLPYLQRELGANDREVLARNTTAIEARHERPTKQLHHSINLNKGASPAETCTCSDSVENGN